MIPVLILFGPTATGKTAIAEKLFTGPNALCKAEIISADSMQVYRGMDIGTAKPPPALLEKLPHHLINIRNPDEQFNAGDFVRLADKICLEAVSRSALPVILGGTGFYLKTFIYGLPAAPPSDSVLREKLKIELALNGPEALFERLAALDPESAQRIHLNDSYRLLRALEVCISSGSALSSFARSTAKRESYHFLTAGLRLPRDELYKRINSRCEDMFRQGLAEEVNGLCEKGYTPDDPGIRAIGYREFFVRDSQKKWQLSRDSEGVKALIAQNSRRYAKRQETFFSGIDGVKLISASEPHAALDLLASLIHTEFNVKA
jgi:tRNA dimethylallyltransferase